MFPTRDMTMDQRNQIISDSKKCFVCFRGGHISKNCKASVKCFICNGRHHSIMCRRRETASSNGQEETEEQSDDDSTTGSHAAGFYNVSQVNKSVLMKTLYVNVVGPKGKQKPVRVLFDEGCQLSYIKTTVAQELKLPVVRKEKFRNRGFGGMVSEVKTRNLHDVILKS